MDATCRNCGERIDGRFCRACGQDSTLALRPLREMVAEWGEAVLGWETRTGRTLRALFLEPGRLTVEYAAGHRADWLHPLRLYLSANVVAFAVLTPATRGLDAYYKAHAEFAKIGPSFGDTMLAVSAALALLVPLGAACQAIAFRGRYYAEHLVLSLNLVSVFLLLNAAVSGINWGLALLDAGIWPMVALRLAAYAAFIAYNWIAVRRVYGLGVWATLWRLAVAGTCFMAIAGVVVGPLVPAR